jgi:hypothetical protein
MAPIFMAVLHMPQCLVFQALCYSLLAPHLPRMSAVFAPTNAAFRALEANLGYTPQQLLDSSILLPTLQYHVVPSVAALVRRTPCMLHELLLVLSGSCLVATEPFPSGA